MNGYRWFVCAAICALSASTFSACVATTEFDDDDGGEEAPVPETKFVGVDGVNIQQVAFYQGVKRVLAQDGVQVGSHVPIVAGRDALVRAFYNATPDKIGQTVKGRLFVWQNGEKSEPIVTDVVLGAQSTDNDLNTTANFLIPGDMIGEGLFGYSLEIVVEETEGAVDNPGARHPVELWEDHAVDGPVNTFRVVLAPFAYNADGSGRVPNIDAEAYRNRFKQLYPVSDVEITVREPTPWSGQITANGQGWQEVGISLSGFRSQDGAGADVYYYGIFNPAPTFSQFCGFGCLLGVTLLNDSPADTGNPGLRLALGVGFDEVARDTAAHELGHAHGREHVNCGPGLDPNSIDSAYPHPGNTIGVWGWDIIGGGLIDPALHTDIMGYCDNQWISDHNFAALLARGKNVNLPRYHQGVNEGAVERSREGEAEYTIAAYDGLGGETWSTQVMAHPVGTPTQVTAITEAGPTMLEGHHYRYDHLPGGWFVFPKQPVKVQALEVAVDGRFVAISR